MNKLFAFLLLLLLAACTPPPAFEFTLGGETAIPAGQPVFMTLPTEFASIDQFQLINKQSEKPLPVQKYGSAAVVFLTDEATEEGKTIAYQLTQAEPSAKAVDVGLTESENDIRISVAGKPVIQYNKTVVMPPEGNPEFYKRSGYIHPVYSPSGKILTDGFPEGSHMHQHGVFFAWVNTTFRGKRTDFWNQHSQNGAVTHISVEETTTGPVYAEFKTKLRHFAVQDGDSIPALEEQWTVRVYASADPFIVDFESEQMCSGQDTLFLNEYHYGGFGIRGSREWEDLEFNQPEDSAVNYIGKTGKGGFFTSEGKTRIGGNHTKPYWVDFHGTVEGEEVGIVAMGYPDNFRFPQSVRIHPTMPYFCFAPMVEGAFMIKAGDVFRSAYRLVVYDGGVDFEKNRIWWETYRQSKWPYNASRQVAAGN